jgi:hypothetical protein
LINICGPKGIGKTAFVLEAAKFISERDHFKDGIVYTDLKGVASTQLFKDKIKESMIEAKLIDEKTDIGTQLQNDNSLYIFDNIDTIINNTGEFDWNICNLLNVYKNLRIILISSNPIKLDNLESVKHESMIKKMPPLTD